MIIWLYLESWTNSENFHWSLSLLASPPCRIFVLFVVYDLPVGSHIHSSAYTFNKWYQRRPCCPMATKNRKTERGKLPGWKKRPGQQKHTFQKMATQSDTNVEIRKFDGKNFALWNEMMQDVLIIWRQVEAIHQSNKPMSMSVEDRRSMDEIACSTIRMHLAENVYFNMAKETTTFTFWEKLQDIYKKQSSLSNSYWYDNYSIWRWERQIQRLPTSTPSIGCYPNSPPKGSTSKKKWKPLPYSRAYRRETDIGKTDNGRSRGIVNQVLSALIVERLVMCKVFNCWSIKRKQNSQRSDQTQGQCDSNCCPTGNQVNVAESRLG